MGRRDDVLHGDFIQADEGAETAPAALSPLRPDRSDALKSLLASIKRDLKDAAQI
jgi:hypothetical protein